MPIQNNASDRPPYCLVHWLAIRSFQMKTNTHSNSSLATTMITSLHIQFTWVLPGARSLILQHFLDHHNCLCAFSLFPRPLNIPLTVDHGTPTVHHYAGQSLVFLFSGFRTDISLTEQLPGCYSTLFYLEAGFCSLLIQYTPLKPAPQYFNAMLAA